jgi:alkylation response protein AidB-like acyl-CoA dehydrogenase
MQRDIFTDEHDAFREVVAGFLDREVVPHHEQWDQDVIVPREVWTAAGKIGLFGFEVPESYGGGGTRDFRFNAIVTEEISSRNLSGLGFSLQNDVVTPYLVSLTNDEQKQRWLPGLCSGELITAIAMTEPGTGSDLQAIRTSAVRDGGDWVLNGQ